ncbi:MAG: PKD domain-containing protein [Nitrospira sp.]|nr:PKD domain-containing protein [Nitrospira sp.]MCP9441424.1 PKD domain-containing protein [Nitrospira sp.]
MPPVPHLIQARRLALGLSGLILLCGPETVSAFKILEPAEGAVLKAGGTATVRVDLGTDRGIVKVRYYWYREEDEVLVEQDDATATGSIISPVAMIGEAEHDPPFGGSLLVPPDGIGPMRLLAVADISQGRLGTRSVFDEITVRVETEATLDALDFETDKPLQLGRTGQSAAFGHVDSLGKIFELPVVGEFSDGVTRRINRPETGTTYDSSNPKVIKVLPGGFLQITGNGKTVITVSNRDKQAHLDVEVNVNDEPNEPPIADAGTDKIVKAGTKVKLTGLKSRDPEGDALYYSWSQVRGNKVALLDVNASEAFFLAPPVSEPRTYRFKLRVTDKRGADSLPAFVNVTVEP